MVAGVVVVYVVVGRSGTRVRQELRVRQAAHDHAAIDYFCSVRYLLIITKIVDTNIHRRYITRYKKHRVDSHILKIFGKGSGTH